MIGEATTLKIYVIITVIIYTEFMVKEMWIDTVKKYLIISKFFSISEIKILFD